VIEGDSEAPQDMGDESIEVCSRQCDVVEILNYFRTILEAHSLDINNLINYEIDIETQFTQQA